MGRGERCVCSVEEDREEEADEGWRLCGSVVEGREEDGRRGGGETECL